MNGKLANGADGVRDDAVTVLLGVTRKLVQEVPLEDALKAVADAALALLPGDHASVRVLDASERELLSQARSGAGLHRRPWPFRPGEGLVGWVAEHGDVARVDDVARDPRFVTVPQDTQGFAIRSALMAPLASSCKVFGVLGVTSSRPGAFSASDEAMIVLLANCAVPPLERARLQRLAVTDPLTLAFNQRYLGRRLQEEIERARRYGLPLSVLLLDLDWFKQVNDAHGHSAGDLVLRVVADRVRASVRRMDVLVRRGGDEFLLIMPHTRREHAGVVAERIRRRLGTEPVELAGSVRTRVTASIGIAGWDGREAAEILEQRADAAMYDAKQQGRDTISESPSASWPPPH